MSLVGSLEDLGLGDILQIVTLSRKSGVLLLRSEAGEGRVIFDEGRVIGAVMKDGPTTLREMLAATGRLANGEFDAAMEEVHTRGRSVEAAVCERAGMSADELDTLRRESAESAVMVMFAWPSGDFSFDVGETGADLDPALLVSTGIDAQYLAMEVARQSDESSRDRGAGAAASEAPDPMGFAELRQELSLDGGETGSAPPSAGDFAATAELFDASLEDEATASEAVFAEDDLEPPEDAAEVVALATVEREVGAVEEAEPLAEVEPDDDGEELLFFGDEEPAEVELELDDEPEAEVVPEAAVSPLPAPAPDANQAPAPVVIVDPELPVLEWLKAALAGVIPRVHIFQHSDQAVTRIRQYVIRGELPLVVLACDAPPDRISGAADAAEIVERLKAQVPRMHILVTAAPSQGDDVPGVDGRLEKPHPGDLLGRRVSKRLQSQKDAFREIVGGWARTPAHNVAAPAPVAPVAQVAPVGHGNMLDKLKQASARLRDPGTRGEVLPLVMEFASDSFSRVAMFLIRDGLAVGMAQIGLAATGGPDDAGLREIALGAREPAWFRAVFERQAAVRAAPSDDGDRRLAGILGGEAPAEAYVAPLESGERIVALLYADNQPAGGAIGDTAALEVVLHEAGLALDRAALERQLAEAEQA